MALVLAVGRLYTQKRISEELARQFSGHEIITAALTADAFARIGSRVPDLVIFPGALFPSEQGALAARLREWSDEQPGGALPIAVSSHSSAAAEGEWFYWFRTQESRQLIRAGAINAKDDTAAAPAESRIAAAAPSRPIAPAPAVVAPAPPPGAAVAPVRPVKTPAVAPPPPAKPAVVPPPAAAVVSPPAAPAIPPPRAAVVSPPAKVVLDSPSIVPGHPARTEATIAHADHDDGDRDATSRAAASRVNDVLTAFSTSARRVGALAAASATRLRILCGTIAVRIGALLLASAQSLRLGSAAVLRALQKVSLAIWNGTKRLSSNAASRASDIEMPSEETRRSALRFAGMAIVAIAAIAGVGAGLRHAGSITSAATIGKQPAEPASENHPPATTATNRGQLNVVSEPPGATVLVDGKPRGVTPVLVDDLTIGQHTVTLNHEAGSVTQSVKVKPNDIATVDLPIFTGWVALFAPFEVQIVDGGRVISLDEQNRAMLPPGRHDLQLINRTLGYRSSQSVVVRPGEVTAASIVPPKAASTITSNPPAELWIDGTRVGDTPFENGGVPIGTREFVFRNASYPERHVTATVTMKPFRLHVDLTKPES